MLDEDVGVLRVRAAIEACGGAARCARVLRGPLRARDGERCGRGARGRRDGQARLRRALRGSRTAALARGAGLPLPVRYSAHVRLAFRVRDSRPRSRRACSTAAAPSASPPPMAIRCSATPPTRSGSARPRRTGRQPPRAAAFPALAGRIVGYVARAFPASRRRPATSATAGRASGRGVRTGSPSGSSAAWSFSRATTSSSSPALGRALAGAALGDGLEPILHPEAKLGMPLQA